MKADSSWLRQQADLRGIPLCDAVLQGLHSLAQRQGQPWRTILAVCPNSAAVLEAAVKVAARCHAPMLFAATLNQVDRDGGYTGWTPAQFVAEMKRCAVRYGCTAPLYPCLDHGGPWLKDRHTLEKLPLHQAMHEVKLSLTACLEAGYTRLRPIWASSITTLVGLLPTAYGFGGHEPFVQPMARAMAWGLAFAMPFTLFLIPMGTLVVDDARRLLMRIFRGKGLKNHHIDDHLTPER